MQAMEEIKAGTFWVNDPLTDNEAGPFGGMRQSGIGRELGEEGLDAFREPKHVHIDYIQERKKLLVPLRRTKVVTNMEALPLYIGGRFTKGADPSQEIINPATGSPIVSAARATREETQAAIRAARDAFDSGVWSAATAMKRGQVLFDIARRLRESSAELARLETENMGKPIFESEFDVADAATCFEYATGALRPKSPARSIRFPTTRSASRSRSRSACAGRSSRGTTRS